MGAAGQCKGCQMEATRAKSSVRRPDPPDPVDVVVVRWPEELTSVERLRAQGSARLLLVGAGTPPPESDDCREDWIRLPADETDLRARLTAVAARATRHALRPIPRDDGRLACPRPMGRPVADSPSTRGRARREVWRRRKPEPAVRCGVAEPTRVGHCAARPGVAPATPTSAPGPRDSHGAVPGLCSAIGHDTWRLNELRRRATTTSPLEGP